MKLILICLIVLVVFYSTPEPTDPNTIAWDHARKSLHQYQVEVDSYYAHNFFIRKGLRIEKFDSFGNGLEIDTFAAYPGCFTVNPELYYTNADPYKDYWIKNVTKLSIYKEGYALETIEKKIRYFKKIDGQMKEVFEKFKTPPIIEYGVDEIVKDEEFKSGYGLNWKTKKGTFLWIREFYIDGKMMYAATRQAKYRINLETGQGEYFDWQESDTDIPIVRFPKDK